MFPITLNGTTYNTADFQGIDYAQKFSKFAYDLMTDRLDPGSFSAGSLMAFSYTSLAYGTGTKAFTIAAGKGFKAGMPVTVYRPDAAVLSTMHGYVVSYVGTTLTLEIKVANSPTAVANANWIISASPIIETRAGTFTVADGGTGTTVAETAWEALKLPKYDTRPEFMDDMEGRVNTAAAIGSSSFGSPFQMPKKVAWVANGAIQQPNYRDLYAAGIPKLGSHPGLLEMSVGELNSKAMLAVNNFGLINFPVTTNPILEVCLYIPEFCTSADTEQFDLWVGMAKYNVDAVAQDAGFNTTPSIPAGWIVSALNFRASGPTIEGAFGLGTKVLPWTKTPGWFTITMTKRFTDLLEMKVARDDETFTDGVTANATATTTGATDLYTPVIFLHKKAGSGKTFRVYVDYWYLGLTTNGGSNLAR